MFVSKRHSEAASDFARELSEDPDLEEFVAEHGVKKAADRAGYDLSRAEIEEAMREYVKQDLPSTELDADSHLMQGLSGHSGCSRCCS